MLWEKWQNHLFAACCWNAGLVWITHAKRALCSEPALLGEICFSLLYSSIMGLPCCGPSSEIAFCVTTYVDINKIWIQVDFPQALLSNNSPVPSEEWGAELFAGVGLSQHGNPPLPMPCWGTVCYLPLRSDNFTGHCRLWPWKARKMSLNGLLWWLDYRQQQNKIFTYFLLLFNLEKSFFQTSGKLLFHVRIMPSLKYLDQEDRGHSSCSLQSSGWSLLRVHQHCQTPGIEFCIQLSAAEQDPFPTHARGASMPLSCWFGQNFSPENKKLSSSKAAFCPEQSWLGWIIVFIEEMCCNLLAFPTVCAPGAWSVWESRALNFHQHLWSLAQPKDVRSW